MGMRGPTRATPVKPPLQPPTRRESGAAMGQGRRKGGDKDVSKKNVPAKPQECGATTGAARPLEWPTSPPEWGTRRGRARPPEWRKTHRGTSREWAG